MDNKYIKYQYGFGLVGRITYFLAESNPFLVMAGVALALALVFLMLTGRRRALFFMLLVSLVFTGSIWSALDAYSGLLRMFLLGLLSLGVVRLRQSPGVPAILFGLYLLFGLPMAVFAPDVPWTLQYSGILVICYAACVSLIKDMDSPQAVARFCIIFVLAAAVWTVIGAISLRTLIQVGTGGERWAAATETAGLFTQIGGTLLPFVTWGAMRPWAWKWRIACGVMGMMMAVILILAAQRTGTIAGILGSLPLLIRLKSPKTLLALAMGGLVAVALYGAASLNQRQTDYVMERYFEGGLSNRDKIWKAGLDVIMENPIMGAGFGSNKRTLREEIGKHIHSMYLGVWYDAGIMGLVFITLSLGAGTWQAWYLVRKARDPETNEAARLMLGLFLNLGASGLVEASASSASDIATVTCLVAMAMTQRLLLSYRHPAPAAVTPRVLVARPGTVVLENPYHAAWLAGKGLRPQS